MKLAKRLAPTPLYLFFFLLFLATGTACSGKQTAEPTVIDRLAREQVGRITLSEKQTPGLDTHSLLGLTDRFVLFRDTTGHRTCTLSAEGTITPLTLDLEPTTTYAVPLQEALFVTDQVGRQAYLLTEGKAGLEPTRLPALPQPFQAASSTIGLYGSRLYLATQTAGRLEVYRLPVTASPETTWEPLTSLPHPAEGPLKMAFQSNGTDVCMYLFCADGTYAYNLRVQTWNPTEPKFEALTETVEAYGTGAGHIILLHKDGKIVHLYNTITHAYSALQTEHELPCLVIQSWKGQLRSLSYDPQDNSLTQDALRIEKVKNGFSPLDILVLVLYFAVLVFIGYYYSKRQKSPDDYFKGGHRIPWWAAGLSLFGTSLSAITFMAIPAKAYATNWSYMLFNSGIVLVAPIIMFVFIPFFRKLNITTAYQYLENRFNALIRVICSMAFIVFQVGRMGVILLLPALAINVVTGFNIFLCVGLMGVFSIIYTRMGGIEAVVWTDALQVVILLGGALFAIFHVVGQIPGGLSETVQIAVSNGKLSFGSSSFDLTQTGMWTVLIATVFTSLTTYGTDQSMVQRYLTTKSQKAARKSVMTNAILVIPATLIFFTIGTVLFVFYKTHPNLASSTLSSNDSIFPWYIYTQLPVGMVGVLISGIFAAAMSTLSGSMNSAATAYITDIRPKLFKKKPEADLRTAKNATLVVGLLSLSFAFLMATWNINSLWDEFNKLLGLILGSMGGLFLLGMITKRANAPGALIGMAVSIGVQAYVAAYTPINLLLYTSVGFITCFIVGYLASLFFRNKTIKP